MSESEVINIVPLGQYKVNNIVLPYPKSAQVSIMSLQGESSRNLNGYMVFDIIRPIMYKVSLTFPVMEAEQVKLVTSAFAGKTTFNFTFLNNLTNEWHTIKAYCGDIVTAPKILKYKIEKIPNTEPVKYRYVPLYEELTVNVIEV